MVSLGSNPSCGFNMSKCKNCNKKLSYSKYLKPGESYFCTKKCKKKWEKENLEPDERWGVHTDNSQQDLPLK